MNRNTTLLRGRHLIASACLAVLTIAAAGCAQDMNVDPKYEPMAESEFWADGKSARPIVAGTVARGAARTGSVFYTGRENGQYAGAFPFPVTREVMEYGRQQFNIFCAPCHSRLGNGAGIVAQRGFPNIASLLTRRVMEAPPGYIFAVITEGRGAMYPYASRIPPRDRWAIVAYVRALQLSQNATAADVSPEQLQRLQGGAR